VRENIVVKLRPIRKVEQLLLHLKRDFKVVLQNPTKLTEEYASESRIGRHRLQNQHLAVRCRRLPP
jgi:hypothetical protein